MGVNTEWICFDSLIGPVQRMYTVYNSNLSNICKRHYTYVEIIIQLVLKIPIVGNRRERDVPQQERL